jgi:hypothetical protein
MLGVILLRFLLPWPHNPCIVSNHSGASIFHRVQPLVSPGEWIFRLEAYESEVDALLRKVFTADVPLYLSPLIGEHSRSNWNSGRVMRA